MNAIDLLLQEPAIEAVGWALLQFIWQGALVGILTALALVALRRSAADVRYVVSAIGLSLMLTMPVMTAVQTWRTLEGERSSPAAAVTSSREPSPGIAGPDSMPAAMERVRAEAQPSSSTASPAIPFERPSSFWLAVMVVVWLGGVAALSLRLLMGWLVVRRMTRRGTSPAPAEWQAALTRLSRQLHVRRPIRLLRSMLVEVPTVIGWLRPVVLLPSSALAGLAPHQLEAILAHELAHIRRHDYVVNLLQTLVETLLFYHPAVWWLSHRIRIERENCCDDLAVGLCGDPYAYARALADLEQMRGAEGRLVLAATGGSLVHRVRRVLGASSHAGRGPGWLAGSAAILVIAGIATGVLGRNVVLARQATDEPLQPTPPVRAVDIDRIAAAVTDYLLEQFGYPPVPPVPPAPPAPPVPVRQDFAVIPTPPPPPPYPVYAVPPAPPVPPAPLVPPVRPAADDLFVQPAPPAPPAPPAAPAPPIYGAVPPVPPAPIGPMPMMIPPAPPAPPAPPVPVAQPAVPVPPSLPQFHFAEGQSDRRRGSYSWSNGKEKMEVRFEGDIEFTDDDKDVKILSADGLFRLKKDGKTVEIRSDASGTLSRKYWHGSSERPFEPEGRAWLGQVLPSFVRQTGIGAPRRVARIMSAKGPDGVLAEITEIESSHAKRIYFSELLKHKLGVPVVRQALAQAGKEIDSDFELASLLTSVADRLLVDDATRQAYLDAARSIDSDFEMQRAFAAALKHGQMSPAIVAALLDASNAIGSDFEHARLLLQVVDQHRIEGPVRAPFFRSTAAIDSSFERGRVLQALAKRPDLSAETVLAILKSAQLMGSNFETGQVLRAVADRHEIAGEARTTYLDAASRLGDFEEGRALTALVKSERRR